MTSKVESSQLGWRTLAYGALVAVIVSLPALISPNTDVLYVFLILPGLLILGICSLIYAAVRKNPHIALMVATFWIVSALLILNNIEIRTFTRWVFWAGRYKNEVLAQATSPNGGLKHVEWDGWGWGGQDFSAFLVFDPVDSLSEAVKNHRSGKLNGIPCEVSTVRRIESHWYIVFFDGYVDQTSWESCK